MRPVQTFEEFPDHCKANLADMQRRAAKISELIDAACEGKVELSDEDMEELLRKVAPHAKHFSQYNW